MPNGKLPKISQSGEGLPVEHTKNGPESILHKQNTWATDEAYLSAPCGREVK